MSNRSIHEVLYIMEHTDFVSAAKKIITKKTVPTIAILSEYDIQLREVFQKYLIDYPAVVVQQDDLCDS